MFSEMAEKRVKILQKVIIIIILSQTLADLMHNILILSAL